MILYLIILTYLIGMMASFGLLFYLFTGNQGINDELEE